LEKQVKKVMDFVTLVLFILGFVLLVGGAELLVRGASKLALAVGISPLVVGLTVVAYGTSAPELAVTIGAVYEGESALAIGNVVGSNISNILLVLGLAASISGLVVAGQLIRIEVPLMIAVSVVLWIMSFDGVLSRIDGVILFAGAVIYTVFVIRKSRKETKESKAQFSEAYDKDKDLDKGPKQIAIQVAMIVGGLILLVFGANWLIDGASEIAEMFGVSNLVIGLTIVAVGTSLPEIATSIMASMRNQKDIAVGNAIGSNIFNILLVLGITSMVAPIGIQVPARAVAIDMPIMIAVAVACLPIFFTDYRISRWEGFLFLGYYITYVLFLYLSATSNSMLDEFVKAMTFFVIPLTVVTLIILTARAFNRGDKNKSETAVS